MFDKKRKTSKTKEHPPSVEFRDCERRGGNCGKPFYKRENRRQKNTAVRPPLPQRTTSSMTMTPHRDARRVLRRRRLGAKTRRMRGGAHAFLLRTLPRFSQFLPLSLRVRATSWRQRTDIRNGAMIAVRAVPNNLIIFPLDQRGNVKKKKKKRRRRRRKDVIGIVP